jgi:hypothetical protein
MRNVKHFPLVHRLPITRIRIFIAQIFYRILKMFLRADSHFIQRRGVNYLIYRKELTYHCFYSEISRATSLIQNTLACCQMQ